MAKSNITMSAIREMRQSLLNQIENGAGKRRSEEERSFEEYQKGVAKSIENDLIELGINRYPKLKVRKTSLCHLANNYKNPEHVRVELTIDSFPKAAEYESSIKLLKAKEKVQKDSVEKWYSEATRSLINSAELPKAPEL
jgi:hypothetical protein